jgi:GT2 family glycosyltransferase
MKIDLLFLTCNRLHYTTISLPALLSDPKEEFSLTIWDNGSTDGTRDYLNSFEDSRITRKVLSKENLGSIHPINKVFFNSSADLVGLVADDLLVTPGWTRPLAQAHADVPEFGMIACWHLGPEYFDEEKARHKIHKFGQHYVLQHPWTNGGVGLVKLKTLREMGPFKKNEWTDYWIRMALKGYVNGYYFPLIHAEHMDYPWSKYNISANRPDGIVVTGSSYASQGIRTIEDANAWHEQIIVRNLLEDPWQAKYYVGWRRKLRNLKYRLRKFYQQV